MSKSRWNPRYSVGNEEIDGQHQRLVEMVSELNEMIRKKKTDEIGTIFISLIEYTDNHFKTEERYFDKYAYPNKIEHKKIHDDLRKTVLDLKMRYEKGERVVTIELIHFLSNWVTNHILNEDKKYAPYIKS